MTKRRKRRNKRNNGPAYRCVGIVVKNPNAQNPLRNGTLGDIFGAFAKTLPKRPVYRFDELMAMKKSELIAIANKEQVKIWLCWNKTKISNAILAK
tara:strand:- start:2441 stop:2728 length:288 start_codon:yes stop_codon:yes gene_type:complete